MDDVTEALYHLFAAISVEMVCRRVNYFTQAHQRGETDDLVTMWLTTPNSWVSSTGNHHPVD